MRSIRTGTGARSCARILGRFCLADLRLLAAGTLIASGAVLSSAFAGLAAPAPGGPTGSSAMLGRTELWERDTDANLSSESLELDRLYTASRPLLVREIAAHALTEPADLYKFLYQAVMGPAHASVTAADALAWLDDEWTEMKSTPAPSPAEPLLTALRADGQLARIHLRALAAHVTATAPPSAHDQVEALARERLAEAFARTADAWISEHGILRGLWQRAVADSTLWRQRIPLAAMTSFSDEVARAGWPAVHHSESYRRRWQPHYRVVAPSLLPPNWQARSKAERSRIDGEATGGQRP